LRNILKRIFEKLSHEIIKGITQLPEPTISWLLKRFKSKKECLIQVRNKLKEKWKEVCEKNFPKSFDHKTFYFVQSEKERIKKSLQYFTEEIKRRYNDKFLKNTTLYIKKGGSADSLYYNSLPDTKPEAYHCTPVEGDIIANMSEM
jgi:histone deacetylase complex regulatory component SIN3